MSSRRVPLRLQIDTGLRSLGSEVTSTSTCALAVPSQAQCCSSKVSGGLYKAWLPDLYLTGLTKGHVILYLILRSQQLLHSLYLVKNIKLPGHEIDVQVFRHFLMAPRLLRCSNYTYMAA